jgi:NAD(P)H dehydrogenase (quinone)
MKLGITGAGGQMGKALVRHARARTEAGNLVAITRDPAKVDADVETRAGDFNNPATLEAAFHGLDRLVIIPTGDLAPGVRTKQHAGAIDAAVKAGVKHVTYISTVSPRPGDNVLFESHFATEQKLIGSGLAWTILRMSVYADALVDSAKRSIAAGAYAAVPGAPAAYVTRDDIAATAAGILTSDEHAGITYHATGPKSVTHAEIAEMLTKITGKPVPLTPITAEQQKAGLAAAGLPPFLVDGIAGFYAAARAGAFDLVTGDVARLTGKPAESLEAFLTRVLS